MYKRQVKTTFDEPPVDGVIVELTPNRTIAKLKELHLSSGSYDRITEDIIICGEVVMDDRSGNYYKTLVIEDAVSYTHLTLPTSELV